LTTEVYIWLNTKW